MIVIDGARDYPFIWYDEVRRREVQNWLVGNDIDPGMVPLETDVEVADGKITFVSYVVQEGQKVRNEDGESLMTQKKSVPLLVDPPAHWTL